MSDEASNSKRPNISIPTIKILYTQASDQCMMENCTQKLTFQKGDVEGQIGEMAHIYADSINGPRGDSNLSKKEKSKENNLILLCRNCHKIIDSDSEFYTPEKLLEIKKNHIKKMELIRENSIADFDFYDLEIASNNIIRFGKDYNSKIGFNGEVDFENLRKPDVKIQKNNLSAISKTLISQGISQSIQIKNFLKEQEQDDEFFSTKLKSGFLITYDNYKEELEGDMLFLKLYDSVKENLNDRQQAASLGLLCYLFMICELFEK
ncbi:hypothetical protein [Methanobrevibacter sp. DSM 116169]|uniref:hypothetical protein n=1 Tax=Methanobrevibacter sp. DSM 116169 TaxID=3242727 RepID=UPI0038FC0298